MGAFGNLMRVATMGASVSQGLSCRRLRPSPSRWVGYPNFWKLFLSETEEEGPALGVRIFYANGAP